jgi:uncharacterized protein (TIGR00251 family)
MTSHNHQRSGVPAERRHPYIEKSAALSRDAATADALPAYLKESPNGVTVAVKVQPRAPRSEIVGIEGGELKIKIAAPPVDSAANEELVEFLATKFDCPRRCVQLLRGQTARHKLLLVAGVSAADIAARLVK